MWSLYITAIEGWLERNGVKVQMFAGGLPHIGGVYRSETMEIFINVLDAKDALLTLAHEAGHWVGNLLGELPNANQREWQAFVYGWRILELFEAPIARAEWIQDCRESTFYRKKFEGGAGTENLYRASPPTPPSLAAVRSNALGAIAMARLFPR